MIENYFEKYPDLIFSLNYVKNIKTIHFWMNNTWVFPEHLLPDNISVQENKQSVDKENHNRYYCMVYGKIEKPVEGNDMVTLKEPSFAELYNVIAAIFEYNLDIERKTLLYENKIKELQEIFNMKPLEELEKMDFTIK